MGGRSTNVTPFFFPLFLLNYRSNCAPEKGRGKEAKF